MLLTNRGGGSAQPNEGVAAESAAGREVRVVAEVLLGGGAERQG